MANKGTSDSPPELSEVQSAAALILEREEERQLKEQQRVKRRRRKRRQDERKAIERMHQSIEIIKWCIVAICSVWMFSFIISIFVLVRVQSKVTEIQGQVERIRHVMDHPFENAGARLGGGVDNKLRGFLGLPEPQSGKK